MLHMFVSWHWLHNAWFQLFISVPVYLFGFYYFGKSAIGSIKSGLPNMDVLIFIGALSSFIYSLAGMLLFKNTPQVEQYLFFETGATIITFVLLGNLIEHRSVKKTTSALASLSKLQVKTAKKITTNNHTEHIEEVNTETLKPNDVLLVNSGESIPADGVIAAGSGYINESMLTGESMPVYKQISNEVFAGTILNEGYIRITVTKTTSNAVLADIVKMVKNAQSKKPQIQKLGDTISNIFVPVVIALSVITFVVNWLFFDLSVAQSMLRSIAVLVISCPCAMGLATPTAVVVGIGKAAKNGILIKGGDTLEVFAKTNLMIFDKTGTLTTGDFTVADFTIFNHNEEQVKNIIYNLELHATHPLAGSIIKKYKNWNLNKINFVELVEKKGEGVHAKDAYSNTYFLGKSNENTNFNIVLLINQKIAAAFNIIDELKTGATDVVLYFKNNNIKTVILSGDDEKKVTAMANHLNADTFKFRQKPADKLNYIESVLQEYKVSMVGDGINDAPALAKVNTALSFGKATEIAKHSSSIILVNKDIISLKKAHLISKHTYQTIKQNLFWAFFYNILCIPLAAAGFLHPMFGALSMALSDVIVIGNSLRLAKRKIK